MPNNQTLTLRWQSSARASCLYAAAALSQGRQLIDERLAATLRDPATRLVASSFGKLCGERGPWRHLLAKAALLSDDFDQVSLSANIGQVPAEPLWLADAVSSMIVMEEAMCRLYPRLDEELTLRSRPLIEQWEARGPGLWRQLGEIIGEPLVDQATVFLVQPVQGGGGASYDVHNAVAIEAVLANPVPAVPEVLRLAWLLAQLPVGKPEYGDDWLGFLGKPKAEFLAFVPAVLAAAEHVELARCDAVTINLALETWWPDPADFEILGPLLYEWWIDSRQRNMNWVDAISSLSEHLPT